MASHPRSEVLTPSLSRLSWALAESEILEQIASGGALREILQALTRAIDRILPDARSSALLVSADGHHLEHGAAPNLPDAYNAAIDGLRIRDGAGSCGTAAARRRQVIVEDIDTDPLWDDFRELAQEHGLRACWSTPVLDADGAVLATFALYYRVPQTPRTSEQALIQRATHLVAVAIGHDRARSELQQTNRALRMLSRCNEALIRAEDEHRLLQAVCDVAVDIGGYLMAWAGYAEHDAECTLRPVAVSGHDAGYVFNNQYSWSEASVYGRGPAGRAVRERVSVFVDDVLEEPSFQPWREAARLRGYRGCVCIPLLDDEISIGVLVFFTPDVLDLPSAERELLQELANDLAYGISTRRSRQREARLQNAVVSVAAALSARAGDDFFQVLAHSMSDTLEADAVGIARVVDAEDGTASARTVHAVVDGESIENYTYSLDGTPCENAWNQPACVYTDGVAALFPKDEPLKELQARGYIGQRLESATGEALGFMYALFRRPIEDVELAASTLQLFAVRAAAELERQQSEQQAREQAALLELTQDAILLTDWQGEVLYWNRGAERTYGRPATEARNRNVSDLLGMDYSHFLRARQTLEATGEWSGEIQVIGAEGQALIMYSRWSAAPGDAYGGRRILQIGTDITSRKRDEARIHQLAYFDSVTGLPNRVHGLERLAEHIERASRIDVPVYLLLLNLNRFKEVNSSLGHDMGDQALITIGERFRALRGQGVFVSRLGGDEFLVIADARSEAEALALAQSLEALVAQPLDLSDQRVELDVSIGITRYPEDGQTPDQLLQYAAIAMRRAKEDDGGARRYEAWMSQVLQEKLVLARRFSVALRRRALELHYQPQVHMGTGRLIGAEALLRWNDPEWGWVSPGRFIPVAEERRMMGRIGEYVVREASCQLAAWRAAGYPLPGPLSLNVAAQQLEDNSLADLLQQAVTTHALQPGSLGLEVTETGIMRDPEQARQLLNTLSGMGFPVSIDDFGTGYSSLSYLSRFPTHMLKIDISFVRAMPDDDRQRAIVAAIIGMAKTLGVQTMAEGVETREQAEALRTMGCERGQGYLYGKPLPADEFIRLWLQS